MRAKAEILRRNFCDMRMKEGECVSKILRTLQPKYVIRVLAIQEMRIIDKMEVSLDALIGKFTTF